MAIDRENIMKKLVYLLASAILLITACGPFQEVIQNAIAGTQTPQASICPEGWSRLEGRGVELCLPGTWDGGSDDRLEKTLARLRSLGPEGEKMASQLESNLNSIIFWAFNTHVVGMNVLIANIPASGTVSQFMDEQCQLIPDHYKQIGGTAKCLETSVISVGPFQDVGRLVIEETISGYDLKAIQYTFPQGNTFWLVYFTTPSAQYSEYLPIFETAITTLNIDQK